MTGEVGTLVCEVYASGANLVVLDGGIGLDGEIPRKLREKIRECRAELVDALAGDPLQGSGWEARTALYRQALRWLDEEIGQMEPEGTHREHAATEALCRQDVADPLNRVWCEGTFDEFRSALREYVRAGLAAAKGKTLDSTPGVDRGDGFERQAVRSRTT